MLADAGAGDGRLHPRVGGVEFGTVLRMVDKLLLEKAQARARLKEIPSFADFPRNANLHRETPEKRGTPASFQ